MFHHAEHFARNHGGYAGLVRFITACNSDRTLEDIGADFGLSGSQVSRLRGTLLRCQWVPDAGTLEYIEFQTHCHERSAADQKEFTACQLRLIQGAHAYGSAD